MPPQDSRQTDHDELIDMKHKLISLAQSVDELHNNVQDLVAAWKAASLALAFLKSLAKLVVLLAALGAVFKGIKWGNLL